MQENIQKKDWLEKWVEMPAMSDSEIKKDLDRVFWLQNVSIIVILFVLPLLFFILKGVYSQLR